MTLLVVGQSGQVATELRLQAPAATFRGRAAKLTTPEAFAEAIYQLRPSGVINAAAYTAVDQAETDTEGAALLNRDAPGAMARACADLGIPFVHISTDYVFDGTGDQAFTPDHPTAPLGAYGRSKRAGEIAVREAGGLYAILRTSWVFSAHGSNFLKTMLTLGDRLDTLTVIDDQIGGPTPADAIASTSLSVLEILRNRPEATGLYHYTGAPDASWYDFACTIFAASGQTVEVVRTDTERFEAGWKANPGNAGKPRAARPLNSRLDCSSFTAQFGISRPNWKTATARIVKELQDGSP